MMSSAVSCLKGECNFFFAFVSGGRRTSSSDHWTPQQREVFQQDWFNDPDISQSAYGEKRTYDEMMNEASTSHTGCGERPYAIENVKEVNIKKFRTKGTNYTLRFNNTMADDEVTNLHERMKYT